MFTALSPRISRPPPLLPPFNFFFKLSHLCWQIWFRYKQHMFANASISDLTRTFKLCSRHVSLHLSQPALQHFFFFFLNPLRCNWHRRRHPASSSFSRWLHGSKNDRFTRKHTSRRGHKVPELKYMPYFPICKGMLRTPRKTFYKRTHTNLQFQKRRTVFTNQNTESSLSVLYSERRHLHSGNLCAQPLRRFPDCCL